MTKSNSETVEGFYAAYFTGDAGSSMGMFLFSEGNIAGADAGGGIYNGHYVENPETNSVDGSVVFRMEIGGTSITGAVATSEPIEMEVPIHFQIPIGGEIIYPLITPAGPVNAKFKKVRNLS